MILKDKSGQTFGNLTAIRIAGRVRYPSGQSRIVYLCRCNCGGFIEVDGGHLKSGHTSSCGCITSRTIQGRITHGMSKTSIYEIWVAMKQRCFNQKDRAYKYYGGRGIKVCERWMAFENFNADMGESYRPRLSIERKDVNGNYEPSNCCWIPRSQQSENTRRKRLWSWRGDMLTVKQILEMEKPKLAAHVFKNRVFRGWDVSTALATPPKK